jgi:hypothetical protein
LIGQLTTTAREWLFGSYQQGLTDNGHAKGAFSVDGIAFLDSTKKKEVAIAYKLNCSAFKLERKDGPLGKSGKFILNVSDSIVRSFLRGHCSTSGFLQTYYSLQK